MKRGAGKNDRDDNAMGELVMHVLVPRLQEEHSERRARLQRMGADLECGESHLPATPTGFRPVKRHTISRRDWLKASAAASAAAIAPLALGVEPASALLVAPFRFDVTPPVGHPLCGGWIKPAADCNDELEAIGFVLLGAGKPIVICAVDWTGILNEAHVAWRTAMAEAAGTTPDRVAVQCVHQHDAPFVCLHAEKLVEAQPDGLEVVQLEFFRGCLDRAKRAIKVAIPLARSVTHIA